MNSFSISIDCFLKDFNGSDHEPYSYIVGTPLSHTNNDYGFKIQTASNNYNGGFEVHINDATTQYFNVISYNNLNENNLQQIEAGKDRNQRVRLSKKLKEITRNYTKLQEITGNIFLSKIEN